MAKVLNNERWFIHHIFMTTSMIVWTIMLCTNNAQASAQEIYIATENGLLMSLFGLLLFIIAFGWIVCNIWSYLEKCLRTRKISLKKISLTIITGLLGLTFVAIFAIHLTLTSPIETQIYYNKSDNTIILYEYFYFKPDKTQIIEAVQQFKISGKGMSYIALNQKIRNNFIDYSNCRTAVIPLDPDVSSIEMELSQASGVYGGITITSADGQKILIYAANSWTSTKHVGRKLHEVTGMPLYIRSAYKSAYD